MIPRFRCSSLDRCRQRRCIPTLGCVDAAHGAMWTLAAMTPDAFVEKWSANPCSERAPDQEHFIDLCRRLGDADRLHGL